MGSERRVVEIPRRYRGGLAEEAYIAGWRAGRRSKELDTICSSIMAEITGEIVQHGLGSLMSADGAIGVAKRLGGRLKRYSDRYSDIQSKARRIADALRPDVPAGGQKKKGRST